MEITEVKVFPIQEEKLKAFVSIVFDQCFMVNDIKIIQGRDGLFISMPSRKKKNGEFKDVAHPLNNETRRMIEDKVLGEYEHVLAERGEALPVPAAEPSASPVSFSSGGHASTPGAAGSPVPMAATASSSVTDATDASNATYRTERTDPISAPGGSLGGAELHAAARPSAAAPATVAPEARAADGAPAASAAPAPTSAMAPAPTSAMAPAAPITATASRPPMAPMAPMTQMTPAAPSSASAPAVPTLPAAPAPLAPTTPPPPAPQAGPEAAREAEEPEEKTLEEIEEMHLRDSFWTVS